MLQERRTLLYANLMAVAKLENDDVVEVITAAVKGSLNSYFALLYYLLVK